MKSGDFIEHTTNNITSPTIKKYIMNPSLLSIFFVALFLFVAGLIAPRAKAGSRFLLFLIISLLGAAVATYAGARAAVLGWLVALWVAGRCFNIQFVVRRSRWWLVLPLIALFFLKLQSSGGRLLIYKVTFTQMAAKDHVLGLGPGGFKAHYNNWQAQYFSTRNLNSADAFLADSTQYLYNDWLQFALELGLVGLLVVTFIAWLLKKIFIKTHRLASETPLLLAANTVLVAIAVAACFSYPLQTPFTFYFFVAVVLVHARYAYRLRPQYASTHIRGLKNGIIGMLLLAILTKTVITIYSNRSLASANGWAASGYKQKALQQLQALNRWPFATAQSWFQQGFLLQQLNQPWAALQCLNKSEHIFPDRLTAALKADVYLSMGNHEAAKENYLRALHMAPNRLQARLHLAQFYHRTGQQDSAVYWAKDLLSYPVKIDNERARIIRQQAQNLLQGIINK
jgi:O-antigen polymerase